MDLAFGGHAWSVDSVLGLNRGCGQFYVKIFEIHLMRQSLEIIDEE
jgi:hypothetical protein